MSDDWLHHCSELLSQRERQSLLRRRQIIRPLDATHVEIENVRYVNFCSNDYLGLTHHPRILSAIDATRATCGAGSGAAPLISGYTDLHASAEAELANWKAAQAAVLLPSGYQANVAAVQTLAAIGESYLGGIRFLIDKLAHASIIDAVRATQAPMRVFPHNGMTKLKRLLEEAEPKQLQVVLSESIFSMDGDAVDLEALAALKHEHDFVLLLDEAHASGVYGPNGAGYAAERGMQNIVDVSIVTLSKAMGCAGGAVCSSAVFRDALLNFGRAYIYSTSVAPAIAAGATAAIEVVRSEPQRQQRVRELARRVRQRLSAAGLKIPPGDSPIIPIIVGSESAALTSADDLKREGLLVMPVRPPTVAPGTSRLRITLCCEHTDQEIEDLIAALADADDSSS